jgi:hypothetical protein
MDHPEPTFDPIPIDQYDQDHSDANPDDREECAIAFISEK